MGTPHSRSNSRWTFHGTSGSAGWLNNGRLCLPRSRANARHQPMLHAPKCQATQAWCGSKTSPVMCSIELQSGSKLDLRMHRGRTGKPVETAKLEPSQRSLGPTRSPRGRASHGEQKAMKNASSTTRSSSNWIKILVSSHAVIRAKDEDCWRLAEHHRSCLGCVEPSARR